MKKNTAKITCIILSLILMAIMAVGCSSDGSKSATTKPAANQTTNSAENTPPVSQTHEETAERGAYTISNETLVDNEYCTFKIIDIKDDTTWGLTINVYCENKTADKKLMFSADDVVINGYMVESLWAEEITPGKKSNEKITFISSELEDIGLTTADQLIFTLRVYDSDDWSADAFVEETFTVYPIGLTAGQIVVPQRKTTKTEQVVVDNADITFIIYGSEIDDIWGYTLHAYIENKTDKHLMFSWDDVSVNGFMVTSLWAADVAPGMRSYTDILFAESDFADNNITTVEEIEYTLNVSNAKDWLSDAIFNQTFTYKP